MRYCLIGLAAALVIITAARDARSEPWSVLLDRSLSYAAQLQWDTSLSYGRQAIEEARGELGPTDTAVARILYQVASSAYFASDYAAADSFWQSFMTIARDCHDTTTRQFGQSAHNLATLYTELGRYSEAEPLLHTAMGIWEREGAEADPILALDLNQLGNLYSAHGRLAQAEAVYREALAVTRRAHTSVHSNMALIMGNLGELYLDEGRLEEARAILESALPIWEETAGPKNHYYGGNLRSQGRVLRALGQRDSAEALYLRSLTIYENYYGANHTEVAKVLEFMAELYCDERRYEVADTLYQRALAIRRTLPDPSSPDLADCLKSYAEYLSRVGRSHPAFEAAREALAIRRALFRDNAFVLAEQDALLFARSLRQSVSDFISIYFNLGQKDSVSTREACEAVLASKGVVSEGYLQGHLAVSLQQDSVTLALFQECRRAKYSLSGLFASSKPAKDGEQFRRRLDSLGRACKSWEAQLARRSSTLRKHLADQEVSVDQVQAQLPFGGVLVEYLRFNQLPPESDSAVPHYLVLVLPDSAGPFVLDLGPAAVIDSLVHEYRVHMESMATQGHQPTQADLATYKEVAHALYGRVLQPVVLNLADKRVVLLAADGELNLVSFAGLMDASGEYLVERFRIHYLSSGRSLIRTREPGGVGHGLLALGDPDFDATVAARASGSGLAAAPVPSVGLAAAHNVRSVCGDLASLRATPLPFTRMEVTRVRSEVESVGIEAHVLTGALATEDAFKTSAPGKALVHLATHGYYLDQDCKTDSSWNWVGENPMLLSGVLLAGFNMRGSAVDSAGLEDGVLSAYEVSAMDLSSVQMVVLSACESGVGEVESGDGVYGLRHAFELAGARVVMSTLWAVPDESTAGITARLYEHLDKPIFERVRDGQLGRIRELRSSGLADHPYSWAATISLGDWR